MEKNVFDKIFSLRIGNIYTMNAIKRSFIIWFGFQILLWLVFVFSVMVHKEAWLNVVELEPTAAAEGGWWTTMFYIMASNLLICLLLMGGNIFVRFNMFTPGLAILFIQAIAIGWLAGSNGFEIPFTNLASANIQYLKVGLWETTAYAFACAVTLPKSLYISKTFPAKVWSQIHKLKDLELDRSEKVILVFGGITLLGASIIETFAIFN